MQKHVCLFSRFFWMKLESCAAVWTAVFFIFPCCVWWRGMRGSSPLLQYCSSRLVLSYRLPHEATRSDILSSFCYLFCFSNSHSSALSSFHLSPSLLHAVTPFCLIIQTRTHAHIHTFTCLGSPAIPAPALLSPSSATCGTNCTSSACFQSNIQQCFLAT